MTYCKDCHTPIPDGSRFCPGCGKRLATPTGPNPTDRMAAPERPAKEQSSDFRCPQTEETPINLPPAALPSPVLPDPDASLDLDAASSENKSAAADFQAEETEVAQKPRHFFHRRKDRANMEATHPDETDQFLDSDAIRQENEAVQSEYDENDGYEDEEDWQDEGRSSVFSRVLAISATVVALLLCFSIAFLSGWVRLPFLTHSDQDQSVIADNNTSNESEEPAIPEPESGRDSFSRAFLRNNSTNPDTYHPDNAQPQPEEAEGTEYTANRTMNLRADPSSSSARTGSVQAGSTVRIVETVNGDDSTVWGKTSDGSYVCLREGNTEYLSLTESGQTPPANDQQSETNPSYQRNPYDNGHGGQDQEDSSWFANEPDSSENASSYYD